MARLFVYFLLYGCIGITNEIFFTALSDLLAMFRDEQPFSLALTGKSYIWMFPIYGLGGLLMPGVVWWFRPRLKWFFRWAIYGVGILAVEFIMGAILEFTTGKCPWEYDSPLSVMGYIRLDYYPFWVGFGAFLETLTLWFNRIIVLKTDTGR